jgi:hypothetical protein
VYEESSFLETYHYNPLFSQNTHRGDQQGPRLTSNSSDLEFPFAPRAPSSSRMAPYARFLILYQPELRIGVRAISAGDSMRQLGVGRVRVARESVRRKSLFYAPSGACIASEKVDSFARPCIWYQLNPSFDTRSRPCPYGTSSKSVRRVLIGYRIV